LLANGVSGLLIWPVDGDTNGLFLEGVARQNPVVLVDRTLPQVQTPSVVLDYLHAAYQITRHLHKQQRQRVLVVCDPVNISSFNQLKNGIRQEARLLGISENFHFYDYPVIELIEAAYQADYRKADAAFHTIQQLLQREKYDAVFCPQSEFFDLVFADAGRADILNGIHLLTLRTPDGPPHSRRYFEMEIDEWLIDTSRMLLTALDLLQDMTIQRRKWRRVIKIPIRHN